MKGSSDGGMKRKERGKAPATADSPPSPKTRKPHGGIVIRDMEAPPSEIEQQPTKTKKEDPGLQQQVRAVEVAMTSAVEEAAIAVAVVEVEVAAAVAAGGRHRRMAATAVPTAGGVVGGIDEERRDWEEELCRAIRDDNWLKFLGIVFRYGPDWTPQIHCKGKPALLLAAQYGSVNIVQELVPLCADSILAKDYEDRTALALACSYNGNIQIKNILVGANPLILTIPNKYRRLPVTSTFTSNFIDTGRSLYYKNHRASLQNLEDFPVAELIKICLKVQCLDIALQLLQTRPHLLVPEINEDYSKFVIVYDIATLSTIIRSRSELCLWKRYIYDRILIPTPDPPAAVPVTVHMPDDPYRLDQPIILKRGHDLLQWFIDRTNFQGVRKIQQLRRLHADLEALYLLVSRKARQQIDIKLDRITEALCLAAKEGNVNFVLQVSRRIPEAHIRYSMFQCFSKAIEYRQVEVFNLIHQYHYKCHLINTTDGSGADLLHRAAKIAPDHVLNRIYSPTLQMQSELQWFEEVESLLFITSREYRNKKGLTAKEIFRQEHKELMKEGEKWIKDTASSCSIVGTLIMTIMFTAVYTIPGGNDDDGYPLFIKQPYFIVFIFSTKLSLLLSSASVLSFLAILTSKYSEEEFLKSLPRKLIFGIVFLFLSIGTMIVAFLSTTYLMLKHTHYVRGLLPIGILAIVPIVLFVWFQLPLLWHTWKSTRRKTFDRKVEPWP